jgi:Family of unknown function (DUF6644)
MIVETLQHIGDTSGIYAFMNTAWGWPAIESLHFIGLATLLGTVGLFDLRLLGFARGISMAALHRFVPFGVAALIANALTGALFLVSAPDQYVYNPAFQLKVACMLVALFNVIVFYSKPVQTMKALGPEANAPRSIKLIAAISLASWCGVIVFGRVITMFRPPYHWCFWC